MALKARVRACFRSRTPSTAATAKLHGLTPNLEPSSHSAQPQTRQEPTTHQRSLGRRAEASAGSEEKLGKGSDGMSQACAATAILLRQASRFSPYLESAESFLVAVTVAASCETRELQPKTHERLLQQVQAGHAMACGRNTTTYTMF